MLLCRLVRGTVVARDSILRVYLPHPVLRCSQKPGAQGIWGGWYSQRTFPRLGGHWKALRGGSQICQSCAFLRD
eukprot:3932032-Rhodomonas_salina.3